MKTIQVNVFSFSELSDEAKEKALKNWGESDIDYFWGNDAVKSLQAFIEHFNGDLSNYNIDFLEPYRNNYHITVPDNMTAKEIFSLLKQLGSYNKKTLRGDGECKLTGYCMDEELIDGFRRAWFNSERDLMQLIYAGIHTWEQAIKSDYEYEFTEEFFKDHAESNNYEFTEDGERY